MGGKNGGWWEGVRDKVLLSVTVPGGQWRVEGDTFCFATLRDARRVTLSS